MPVELWIGNEYEHFHEMSALATFLKSMVEVYGDDEARYLILVNFIINNQSIDLAVIKRNAIIVIELKHVSGRVVGGENGPWMVGKPGEKKIALKGGGHGNPFRQVRDYHQTMIGFLQEYQGKFLEPRAGMVPALHHVSAYIVLSPLIHPKSEITIPKVRWLRLVGLDQLHLEVYKERSAQMKFSKREMYALVRDVMRLRKADIARYISIPEEIDEDTSEKAEDVCDQRKPEVVVLDPGLKIEKSLSKDSKLGQVPLGVVETTCPICDYLGQQCERGYLRGTIIGIKRDATGKPSIQVDTGELTPITLYLDGVWSALAPSIAHAKSCILTKTDEVILTLSAFHTRKHKAGWIAGNYSLVILEPDWLIKVTDLTKVEYCQRQLPLGRLIPPQPNKAIIRGSIVHQLFPRIWDLCSQAELNEAKAETFLTQTENIAIAGLDIGDLEIEVDGHINHLMTWSRNRRNRRSEFHSETFVLSPQMGLKGRIDALWEREGRPMVLGELKTGRCHGANAKPGDVLQLVSYALTMFSRSEEVDLNSLYAILLYSGNKQLGDEGRNVLRRFELTWELFLKATRVRNDLVLMDYTGDARFEENPRKCNRCSLRLECARYALLCGHADPRERESSEYLDESQVYDERATAFFKHYTSLLIDELRVVKMEHARLWTLTPQQRETEGRAFEIGSIDNGAKDEGWTNYSFAAAKGRNETEFRRGDSVLISGAQGPGGNRVALGVVVNTSAQALKVKTNDEVRFSPKWIDLYTDERMTERLFSGLYRFLSKHSRSLEVIVNEKVPQFNSVAPKTLLKKHFGEKYELNSQQKRALELSLQAEDFLLIWGPPGSGKTLLIEHIVRAHLALDHRVLVSAGTNRALDQALVRLARKDLGKEVLRLGNVSNIDPELALFTLPSLMGESPDLHHRVASVRKELADRRIVGATAYTLLSGRYDGVLGEFDIAIVDEATQMTVPATLGPLRLADRFVLIGDPKQLPAVVQSKERTRVDASLDSDEESDDLSVSLFEILSRRTRQEGADGMVTLTDQYRMNETICAVPSRLWYGANLKPADKKTKDGRLSIALEGAFPIEEMGSELSPDRPIIFIDVPPDESAGPRTNRSEAIWIQWLVKKFQELGQKLPSLHDRGNIAVIAPFRAQVALIRRLLEDIFNDQANSIRSMVDTVDRFQGSESDIVIVSLATGSGDVHELLRNERRLNVALTRAKYKLILLGNSNVLMKDPTYFSLLRTIEDTVDYPDWLIDGSKGPGDNDGVVFSV